MFKNSYASKTYLPHVSPVPEYILPSCISFGPRLIVLRISLTGHGLAEILNGQIFDDLR